jgi:hypothetical protein
VNYHTIAAAECSKRNDDLVKEKSIEGLARFIEEARLSWRLKVRTRYTP